MTVGQLLASWWPVGDRWPVVDRWPVGDRWPVAGQFDRQPVGSHLVTVGQLVASW